MIETGNAAGLAYDRTETADSGPLLLLVHGFPLSRLMWRAQLQLPGVEVLAPDLRGFGDSAAWDSTEPLTMAGHADDLASLLDALNIAQPIWLAGLSMGGYVAWEFWRRHRSRVRGLALLDTKAAPDSDEAKAAREATAERVLADGVEVVAHAMMPKLLAPAHSGHDSVDSIADQLQAMMLGTAATTVAAALRGMACRRDAHDLLATIDVPTLVICGEEDVISTPAEMRSFAARIPNHRYVEIPGSGHMTPMEAPKAVNQALLEWLQTEPQS